MADDNSFSVGLFTTDRNLVIRSWDPALARMTGIAADAAVGRALTKVVPDLESRGLIGRFQRVLTNGTVEILAPAFHRYLIPCPPRRPSSHFRQMRQKVTVAPLLQAGEADGTLVTIEDVTERMEQEHQLATALRSPDEAVRLDAATRLAETPVTAADRLLDSLADASWRVRRAAVEGLSKNVARDTVGFLLRTLKRDHRDPNALNSVLQVLASSQVDVLETLAEFLTDPDPELRFYTATVLGERRDPRAAPHLLPLLKDPDRNVRFHAIEALGKVRAAEAVEPLMELAEGGDFFLGFTALDALARIGDPSVAGRIAALLENDALRPAATEVLGELGDDRAVPVLAEMLNRPDAPIEVVARALCGIHDRYEHRFREGAHITDLVRRGIEPGGIRRLAERIQQASGDDTAYLAKVFGWLDGPLVAETLARLLGRPETRREALEALVRMGPNVTTVLIRQLDADDPEVRRSALVALGRIGHRDAVPKLLEVLDQQPDLTVLAAGALAKIGDRRAFEPLLDMLGHPDPGVRMAVVGALHSIGHPRMAGEIRTRLEAREPRVRISACQIAGYFGYPECVDALLRCCRDPEQAVRRTAVEQLPYIEDPRAGEVAVAALVSDTAPVRAAAARALGRMEHPGKIPRLLAALSDANAWVRYHCATALAGVPAAEPELIRLAESDPAGQVRIAAAKALASFGGDRVVAVLSSLCDAADEDLAAAALIALGATDHRIAAERLREALRHPEPTRRAAAVQAVARSHLRDRIHSLQWVAASDCEPRVAAEAIDALAKIADGDAITALIALGGDPQRREPVIEALSRLPRPAVEALGAGLDHPGEKTRLTVVEALARMRRPEASRLLARALDDRAPRVRAAAVRALGRLGSRQAEAKLLALAASDPAPEVRRAVQALLNQS